MATLYQSSGNGLIEFNFFKFFPVYFLFELSKKIFHYYPRLLFIENVT